MKPTGIVRDEIFIKHEMGSYHPESPRRLEVIYDMIDGSELKAHLVRIPIREATQEELAWIHDSRYVKNIAATAGKTDVYLDPDTSTCADSWDAASRAAGSLFSLTDAVIEGQVRNGFALVRPPGHHAEKNRAMGFCLFNNIALAAQYALKKYGLKRVAIVDWDLHHGNGTQHSFYEDPSVLFVSTHQYPHYPGTGGVREVGAGSGEGYTVNVPLPSGCGDQEYLTVYHALVAPLLRAYKPELILVSAGFDTHELDPLGGMDVTEDGYEQMLQILMHLASEVCSDRLILTLEGGYNLRALRESVKRVLSCLSTYEPSQREMPPEPSLDGLNASFKGRLRDILTVQGNYWSSLREQAE